MVQPFEGDLYTPTVKPITDKTIDVFVKKYEEFMRAREGGGAAGVPPQQQIFSNDARRGKPAGYLSTYPPYYDGVHVYFGQLDE